MNELPPPETVQAIERIEALAMIDLMRAVPQIVLENLSVNMCCTGTAHAFILEEIDWPLLIRVIGLGMGTPATEAEIDAIRDLYRHTWMTFAVQLSPGAQPADLPTWLEARGIRRRADENDSWVKFWRGVEPPPAARTDLRVERVEGEDRARTWAALAHMACCIHRELMYWLMLTVGRPGWQHYLAFDGDLAVACAALYVHDGAGWLGFGGTMREWRGRGAQSALIARRIRDAADLGCRWLTVETEPETPRWPNPSYRNMLRAGFQVAYHRPNYRLRKSIKRHLWSVNGGYDLDDYEDTGAAATGIISAMSEPGD